MFDTEEERVHNFVFSLHQQKYAGWHRDMCNGVLEVPVTIEDAIEVAKDRKEIEAHVPTTGQSSGMPLKNFPVTKNLADKKIFARRKTHFWVIIYNF